MLGPWRFHIADFMMLVLGDIWGSVQWRFHPENPTVMIPVVVTVREKG